MKLGLPPGSLCDFTNVSPATAQGESASQMLRVVSLNSYSQSTAPTSHFTMRLESVEYLIFKSPLQLEVHMGPSSA